MAAPSAITAEFPGVADWIAEASFAHESGYGGKVDLHSPSTGIVVDYKGKDGDFSELDTYGKPKKLAWDQHWQLGAYQVGLRLPNADCANVFFSRTHPGARCTSVSRSRAKCAAMCSRSSRRGIFRSAIAKERVRRATDLGGK